MLRRRLCLALSLSALALLTPAARGAEKPSVLASVPALARPVAISAYRIYLGELLERLSRETGVRLEVDERKAPLSGYELALVIHDQPAWQVLEGIRRTYNFAPDRWYWTHEHDSKRGDRYLLHNTLTAAQLARAREERSVELLETEFRARQQFYALPRAQRDALVAADTRLLHIDNETGEQATRFLASVPPAALQQALSGSDLSFPFSELSGIQRQYVSETFQRRTVQMGTQPAPTFDSIKSVTIARNDARMGGLPTVVIRADLSTPDANNNVRLSDPLGGFATMDLLRDRSLSSWLQSDESTKAEDQPVPANSENGKTSASGMSPRGSSPDEVLERLGKLGNLDLIYDRPVGEPARFYRFFHVSLNGRLPAVLESIHAENLICKQWKQPKPLYLFRLADWESNPRDVLLPWSEIKKLRAQVDDAGIGTLQRLASIATLSPQQRGYVERDFPRAANPAGEAQAEQFQHILQFAAGTTPAEWQAMSHQDGAGWMDWTPKTRQRASDLFGDAHVKVLLRKIKDEKGRSLIQYGLAPEGAELVVRIAYLFPDRKDPGTLFPVETEPGPAH